MKKNTAKLLAALLLIALSVTALASCGIVVSGEYRLGLATVETANGQVAAAVVTDSNDRIVLVRIDEVDLSSGVTASKKAQGDEYGMAKYNKDALAEWDKQVAYLERELIGMTKDEVLGLAADDADVTAGCTIYAGTFKTAVAKAMTDAEDEESFKATVDNIAIALTFAVDKLAGADDYTIVVTSAALSRGYTLAEKSTFCDPIPQSYKLGIATLVTDKGQVSATVITDASDRIVIVRIDELDLSGGVTVSKKAQGDDYGMLSPWGSQLAEWDDQIAHLERKLAGKSIDELAATSGSDADIAAGCTVYIDNYTRAAAMAVENAKTKTAFEAFKSDLELALTITYTAGEGSSYTVTARGVVTNSAAASSPIELTDTRTVNPA